MKLRWQLFWAFLAVTIAGVITNTVVNYDSTMNLLLLDQRLAIRQEANGWLQDLNTGGLSTADWYVLSSKARAQGLDVVLVSKDLVPIRNSFPSIPTRRFIQQSLRGGIFVYNEKQYVFAAVQYFSNGHVYFLIIGAPPNWQMLSRKALIYLAELMISGVLVSSLISAIMSNRISKPLLRLNNELQKVAKLRFTDVQKVQASGEVGEVAEGFYMLSQELERAISSEKQFFRHISHELRTPLMAIQGYAEGIRDGVFKENAAQSGLDTIVDESVRLKKLVDELIQLSKADGSGNGGLFTWTTVDVTEVLREAIDILLPLCRKAQCNITTSFNCAGIVCLDGNKLLQAFINILVNGIRYAEKSIEIVTVCTGEHVVVEIIDDGPGIPDTILDQIFNSFVKGTDGQTGLGLYIAKHILAEFHGTISAHNGETGGAVFRISLPAYLP